MNSRTLTLVVAALAAQTAYAGAPARTMYMETLAREQAVRAVLTAHGALATIKDIRRSVTPESVRVTIELDGEASFHDEHIADPERVFVDLAGTRAGSGLVDRTLRFESDADVVRQVRIGRHPNSLTRVVLDAAGVSSYSVYPLYSP